MSDLKVALRAVFFPALVGLAFFASFHQALSASVVACCIFVLRNCLWVRSAPQREAFAGLALALAFYGVAGIAAVPGIPAALAIAVCLVVLTIAEMIATYRACAIFSSLPVLPPRRYCWNPARWREILAVQRAVFPGLDARLAVLQALLDGSLYYLLEEGRVAAIAAVCRNLLPGAAWLTYLAVRPECRRRGYARRLLYLVGQCCLTVRADNFPAQELYQSTGFLPVRLWRNYYGPGHDALLMAPPDIS